MWPVVTGTTLPLSAANFAAEEPALTCLIAGFEIYW
jgi:hypothetical protein